jgi:hypothetical protein
MAALLVTTECTPVKLAWEQSSLQLAIISVSLSVARLPSKVAVNHRLRSQCALNVVACKQVEIASHRRSYHVGCVAWHGCHALCSSAHVERAVHSHASKQNDWPPSVLANRVKGAHTLATGPQECPAWVSLHVQAHACKRRGSIARPCSASIRVHVRVKSCVRVCLMNASSPGRQTRCKTLALQWKGVERGVENGLRRPSPEPRPKRSWRTLV